MIDLPANQLTEVIKILNSFPLNAEIRAFGSRVTHTAKKHSDLDLVIVGDEIIPQKMYYQIKDAFEESDLLIKVDVLDWHRISQDFRDIIEKKYEIISPKECHARFKF